MLRLRLVYDTEWIEAQAIDPENLVLYTRKTSDGKWEKVFNTYVTKQGKFIADLHHFSEYKLGIELKVSGDILPSVRNFSSDLFTGAATVNYPIEVPTGPGGMAPSLSLNYSSNTSNDFYDANRASGSDWDTQASPIGAGQCHE